MIGIILAAFVATVAQGCPQFFAGGQPPQAQVVQICYDGYSLGHSAEMRAPIWSAEHLTADGAAAALAAKRTGTFHAEKLLAKPERAELADYRCEPFDRGHMTPVGDFGDAGEERDTFTLANMVPQVPELNEGLWAGIEGALLRQAAGGDDLYIVTGPRFAPDPPRLKGRVAVPAATWKAVYEPAAGVAFVYVAANDNSGKYFVETVGALAAQLGFDPMPGVPDAVKKPGAPPPAPAPLKGNAKLKPRTCH